MIKIFNAEFSKYIHTINIKSVLEHQSIDKTVLISCLFTALQFMGLNVSILLSIVVLFSMMLLDLAVKRTVVARKFNGINNARKTGFWKSHITREKLAKKTANYSFIITAVFLMTLPFSFYDIGIGPITTGALQQLLRIISTCILIGIEFDSVMENIKSQFSEEEQKKIDSIYLKVKAGTTDIMEARLENILDMFKSDVSKDSDNSDDENKEA